MEHENEGKNVSKAVEQGEIMDQIKKTIANHGIKEEDLDNVLNQTFNAIPGLDEATKNEYKN